MENLQIYDCCGKSTFGIDMEMRILNSLQRATDESSTPEERIENQHAYDNFRISFEMRHIPVECEGRVTKCQSVWEKFNKKQEIGAV